MVDVQDHSNNSINMDYLESPENDYDIPDFFKSKPKRKSLIRIGRQSNIIVRNAGHIMPFPVHVAYEKFSDFSRHSEWNPNIRSSEYVDPQQTLVRWTRETLGFVIGWTTKTTVKERNKALAWKSIEGIKVDNRVVFQSVDDGRGTLMIMSSSYKVPEKVFIPSRKMVGKKNNGHRASNHTIESEQIKEILERFCEAVVKEEERDAMYFT